MGPLEIEKMLQSHFPQGQVSVRDMTGGGDHFELVVSSRDFRGKSLMEQHRMVYQALGDSMSGPIHAVKIQTKVLED